ncbi:MAG: glycosyltransferase family 39 protein [Candidatus Sumerlaeota bacterium]|nr:glycosyltransferase family 39 protein [Candidatus Sumerlaeota bacterium]
MTQKPPPAFSDHQSAIVNPQSSIVHRQSSIRNPTVLFYAGVLALTALGLALRLLGVDQSGRITGLNFFGLWYDETFSGVIALKSWSGLIATAQDDVHPPLFYLALKCWFACAPGARMTAEWARLLPVLLGAACVPATALLGAVVFSRRVGLIAALFLALSPYHVAYSHELRMYSLGCLVMAGEMIFLWRVARRPHWRDALFFCVFAALGLYTHYYIAIILIAHFIFFAAWRAAAGDRFLVWIRWTLAMGLGVLILYLPWFTTYLAHSLNNVIGVHAFGLRDSPRHLIKDVIQYLFEWTLGSHPRFPFENSAHPINDTFKGITAGLLIYGLMIAGLAALAWRRREQFFFAAGALVLPLALTALYILGPGRFFTRCLIFLFPILFCVMACGIESLPRRLYQWALGGILAAIFIPSAWEYLHNPSYRDNHHFASRYLDQIPAPAILCSRPFDFVPTAFYDNPRARTYLLNSQDLSYIQRSLMGSDRIVFNRRQMLDLMRRSKAPDQVILVISAWDFAPLEEREANLRRRVEDIERQWLGADFTRLDSRLFFPRHRKWVYCGLYQLKPGG